MRDFDVNGPTGDVDLSSYKPKRRDTLALEALATPVVRSSLSRV
jgi:hypothetical protein